MENGTVYNPTTEPQAKASCRPFGCTLRHLSKWRRPFKALQVILSLLAVIFEEIVEKCIKCGGLYFFEFTSCSAFLLSLLILCVYCTDVYETFGEDKVQRVNFWAMLVVGVLFLIASIVFAATSSGSIEAAAYVFGFLAAGAFLAEIGVECYHNQKQKVDKRLENPGNPLSVTENQPLNKQTEPSGII